VDIDLQDYLDDLLAMPDPMGGEAAPEHLHEPVQAKPVATARQAQARPRAEVRSYLDPNRPHWAQQQFDAIVICSQGYHFTLPLQDLLSVNLLEQAEALKFAETAALSITTDRATGPAHIAHIAKLLLLEEYQGDSAARLSYLLVLKNSDWGLAVDSVSDRVRIDPDTVRWHMDRGNRPWVAGTLFDSHYPLLDIRQLVPVLTRLLPRQ
jgi:purine-binding chemotaxis protein CheW